MRVFVDTSALFALQDAGDLFHQDAVKIFNQLATQAAELITTSYVLIETVALTQRRLGLQAVKDFIQNLEPLLSVVWITEDLHRKAEALLLHMDRRQVSLVDCASFVVMRELGLMTAFANDPHFTDAGFSLLAP